MLGFGGWNGYQAVHLLHAERDRYPAFRMPMVCLPASIDNNLPGWPMAVGSDTALNTVVRSIDMVRVAPSYAANLPQLFSVECWGGATFDVAYRFLQECPWQRLRDIRARKASLPVLILSARSQEHDKIDALDVGADDYLTKPFHLAELNARIKSVIRRKQQDGELQLSLANLTIYPDKHSVYINGKEIVLNRKEFDLLYYFISNPNRLISKATLAESVWGDYIDQADNFDFIYSHIKNLKAKLAKAGVKDCIKTIYGTGYQWKE